MKYQLRNLLLLLLSLSASRFAHALIEVPHRFTRWCSHHLRVITSIASYKTYLVWRFSFSILKRYDLPQCYQFFISYFYSQSTVTYDSSNKLFICKFHTLLFLLISPSNCFSISIFSWFFWIISRFEIECFHTTLP